MADRTIKISVNTAHPAFVGKDPKKISVAISVLGDTPHFMYDRPLLDFNSMGDAGVSPRILRISSKNPIQMTDKELGIWGNIQQDTYAGGRVMAVLADYVKRGVLIVTEDNVAMTPSQLLRYVSQNS